MNIIFQYITQYASPISRHIAAAKTGDWSYKESWKSTASQEFLV